MPAADTLRAIAAMRKAGLDISDSGDDLFFASLDHSRHSFMPAARVRARGGGDVSAALRIASEFGVPICPARAPARGARAGASPSAAASFSTFRG